MEATYASKGVANAGLVTGIVGSALGIMGNNLAGNLLGGGAQTVNQETFEMQNKLTASETANALLSSELNTERKLVEMMNATNDKIMKVQSELQSSINSLESTVNSNAAAQAVINCGFTSADAVLQTQVAQLMSLTKVGIPNTSLCPGYGNVTISPATAATTG